MNRNPFDRAVRRSAAACLLALLQSLAMSAYAAVPATPTGTAPGSLTSRGPILTSASVKLTWNASARATRYTVRVHDVTAEQMVLDKTTFSSGFVANLQPNKQYRWEVAACNASDCSDFTPSMFFQSPRALAIPAVPAGTAPGSSVAPGPTLTSGSVRLTWNASAGATSYTVRVNDIKAEQTVLDRSTTGSGFVANLQAGKVYGWGVAACNGSGCSDFTAATFFQVDITTAVVSTERTATSIVNADGGSNNSVTATISQTGSSAQSRLSMGTRVAAAADGTDVGDAQLTLLFRQVGGVHGTVISGPLSGTAGGVSGDWWQIQWDSVPPTQQGTPGWTAESSMTKAPRNGDAAVPDLNSRFYRSDVNPLWARGQAPGAPGWNADALGSSTWYAYGRMLELGFSPDQLLPIVAAGTAAAFQWAIHARNIVGVAVNSEPLPGSIAVDSKRDGPTSNGHVAVVEAVNGDMITVTESSRVSADGANSAWNFLWRHRTVPKTAFAEYIHIAHTQVFSSKAAGPLSGRALDVRIQTPPEDVATDGQVFIAAAVGKTVYFLTTAGWQLWTEGDFPSYFAGALPLALSVQLLDGSFDVSLLLGAQIYVGYGRNAAEMLANRRYAVVHTLH